MGKSNVLDNNLLKLNYKIIKNYLQPVTKVLLFIPIRASAQNSLKLNIK